MFPSVTSTLIAILCISIFLCLSDVQVHFLEISYSFELKYEI